MDGVAALGQQDLELVEEDVAAGLADVQQGDRLAVCLGRRQAPRERPAFGVALGGRVEEGDRARFAGAPGLPAPLLARGETAPLVGQVTQVHGSTLTVTGAEPISPAAQLP